jgi:hypothetical protein
MTEPQVYEAPPPPIKVRVSLGPGISISLESPYDSLAVLVETAENMALRIGRRSNSDNEYR